MTKQWPPKFNNGLLIRAVTIGEGGADQLTLSGPGGAHYPHPVLLAPLPGFLDLATALLATISKNVVCYMYVHASEKLGRKRINRNY